MSMVSIASGNSQGKTIFIVLTHLAGGRRGVRQLFPAGTISLGRDSSNDLAFKSQETKVSARHAKIVCRNASFRIRDLKSTNGTYINGQKITEAELINGDIIELGLGGPRVKFELEHSNDPIECGSELLNHQ